MKKLFLVILAAGLFVACGNTNDKPNADKNDANKPVADKTATEDSTKEQQNEVENIEGTTATTGSEDNSTLTVSANENGGSVNSELGSLEVSKDGKTELKINTKDQNNKGNR